jgi:molybdate transport system regulatory protein
MPRLTIRIDFENEVAFGPGKARLLELIEETGSLRRAATAMDMSYRRAWLLLQETEAMMKTPVTTARTGGAQGGGTALTPLGQKIVECYRSIEARAGHAAAAELRAIGGMAKSVSVDPPRARKVTRRKPRKPA